MDNHSRIAANLPSHDRVVVIEASTRCNLACGFCAYDSRRDTPRHAIPEEDLRDFLGWLGRNALHSGERILVSWLGGEPFLYKPLAALTEEARRHYPLRFSATTNGTALRERAVREHVLRCYAELTVSVDGLAPLHDDLRGRAGVFAGTRDGVRALLDAEPGFRVRANVVLMRRNFDELPALCAELAAWGVREITFNQLGGRDRPEFHRANRLTLDQASRLATMAADLYRTLAGRGVHLAYTTAYLERILASARDEALPVSDCAPGTRYVFVNAQGRMAPCSFTTDEYGCNLAGTRAMSGPGELHERFSAARRRAPAAACSDCPCTNVHGKFSREPH